MNAKCTRGMSLIELLVAIGITVLLISFTLVGVQFVRESSRRLSCSNNLHQLGVAIHAFEARKSRLPDSNVKLLSVEGGRRLGNASVHYELLPDIEQTSLSELAIPGRIVDGHFFTPDGEPQIRNHPLVQTSVPIFLCPSDASNLQGTNYRFCTGPDSHSHFHQEINEGGKGAFVRNLSVNSFKKFTRGLSNTILCSEKLMSVSDTTKQKSAIALAQLGEPLPRSTDELIAIANLANTYTPVDFFKYGGHFWSVAGYECTEYNHVFTPNFDRYSFLAHGSADTGYGAIMTASSNHPGGVFALFADGSVSFVGNEIDLQLWRTQSNCGNE